jgi:hypothetical protein
MLNAKRPQKERPAERNVYLPKKEKAPLASPRPSKKQPHTNISCHFQLPCTTVYYYHEGVMMMSRQLVPEMYNDVV